MAYGPQSVSLTQAGGDLDLLEALRGGRGRVKTQQEMLREQSMSPVEIGSYNGIQGKFPISQGINKIAQGLLATYMDSQARDRAQEAANEKTASDKAGVDALVTALSGRPADAPMPDDMPGVVRPAQAPLTGDPRQMALITAMTGSSPSAARAAEFVSRQDQATEARIPAGFRANPDGSLTHILGGPADPAVMRDRTAATHVPSPPPAGFRANPDGSLTPIPGGPQSTDFLTSSRAITHPPSSGPFEGTGMDQQIFNILLNGDPSTAIYASAYNRAANPIVRPDGSTVTPNMSAHRPPTFNPSGSGGGVPMPTAGQVPGGGVPPAAPTGGVPMPTAGQVPGGGPTVVRELKDAPETITSGMLGNTKSLTQIDRALADLASPNAKNSTGYLAGMAAGASPSLINSLDPKGVDVRARIANIGSMIIHDRSGANVTVSESPRLAPFVPMISDPPNVINTKLKQLREAIHSELKGTYDVYGPTAGFKNNSTVEKMLTPAANPSLPPIPPGSLPPIPPGWRLVE